MSLHKNVCLLAALLAASWGANAQPARAAAPGASSASTPAPSTAAASLPVNSGGTGAASDSLRYRSAFEGYRRYADEPVTPWKAANDQVGRIGGWKTYAKEAAGDTPGGAHGEHGASPAPGAAPPDATRPAASGPTPPRAGTATTDKPFGQSDSATPPKAAPRPTQAGSQPAAPASSATPPAKPADHTKHH